MPTSAAMPFEDFDPNNLSSIGSWATYAPGRKKGVFSVHTERPQALQAINYASKAKLYRLSDDGLWELVATKDGRSQNCEICGSGLAGWLWRKDRKGRIPETPVGSYLCWQCKHVPLP